ncbi:MAG TPA: GNAT family N-acetyltransferase [Acidimicrobiia bacterium]|nr:GNAT family N-acetyltransferase [Acidimicrobiia bacterium]
MCRPALASDVPAIVALLADDELGAQREYAHTPLDPAYLHAFDAVDANPNELLAVACIDDRVIGTLQMTFLHHLSHRGAIRAHIESVRVASSLRGRGIGHELMEWALDRARGQGARIAQLSTDKTRTDAHRFYESLGFHATHEGMKFDFGER